MKPLNKKAMIVLHEIYGINSFIKSTCQKLESAGFDVFCPNMIGRVPFSYAESHEAYDYFMKHVGFDVYKEISEFITQLKDNYEKVVVFGFSAGATIAWKCCENASCDGIVACYGSRIRDYTGLTPVCPVLLIFAGEESFDINSVVASLQGKPHVKMHKCQAMHGFMDLFSESFNREESEIAADLISAFLSEHVKNGGLI